MVELLKITSVSVPIHVVRNNLHVDVSAQVDHIQNQRHQLKTQNSSNWLDFCSRLDFRDTCNNVRQYALQLLKAKSRVQPHCKPECLFKYNIIDMMSGNQLHNFFSRCISTKMQGPFRLTGVAWCCMEAEGFDTTKTPHSILLLSLHQPLLGQSRMTT